jgi:aminobenzoyl-glutamate utilization protein B
MSIGFKGALQAAHVLAWTGLDVLTDAGLREDALADFERRVNEHPYVSPLPPELKRPVGLPEWLNEAAIAGE